MNSSTNITYHQFCFSNIFGRDECLKLMKELQRACQQKDQRTFASAQPLPSILADLSDDYSFSHQVCVLNLKYQSV